MKLTMILLTAGFLNVAAKGVSQSVTFTGKKVPLQKVFSAVEQQTGYYIFYNDVLLQQTKPITIEAQNVPLQAFMDKILSGQQLAYTIESKSIIISRKLETADLSPRLDAPAPPITGIVRGPDGQPLAGVNVVVKGTKKGVVTDAYGRFSIDAETGQELEFSSIGYLLQKAKVSGLGLTLNVQMEINNSQLDEVQYIAYGQTSRRFSTGNTSTIKAEDIAKQPVNNSMLAISGRVPGLQITQANGLPGGAIKVRVQGQNSMLNGNTPLILVDGIAYPYDVPGGNLGPLGNSGESSISDVTTGVSNALAYLNPDDIESIDILKDADATAIYGSRAANGAILIRTKKGKSGKATFNSNIQRGWGKVANTIAVMNRREYLDMRYEAFKNDGLIPSSDPFAALPYLYAPDLTLWDTTRETNWVDKLIGGTSEHTNVNVSVSGGNSGLQYRLGGTFNKETTVFSGSFSDDRQSASFNLGNNTMGHKFRFQLSGSYLFDNNRLPRQDMTTYALSYEPVGPPVYSPDGNLHWAPNGIGNSTWLNPVARYLYSKFNAKTKNFSSNVELSYSLLPNLELKLLGGYRDVQTNQTATTSLLQNPPEFRPFSQSSAGYQNADVNTWSVQPQIKFYQNMDAGKLEVLIGAEFQNTLREALYIQGDGYASDLLLNNPASASSLFSFLERSRYRYNAFWGRLNYNLNDKYIINLSGRRDGTSRFGPASRFHNFGSIGAAWIVSEESWMNKISFISFLKFKASYGTTGNDQIGDYVYQDLYGLSSFGILYQGLITITPRNIPNPYLSWEETKKLNVGIDLGILKDRILLGINVARNRSSNQLLSYQLPEMTGFNAVNVNFPALVQNISMEGTLATTNIKTKNVKWSMNLNLTIPRNKLLRFDDLSTSSYASTFMVGQPVSIIRAFHSLGVDPTTGVYTFADNKGNATTTPDYNRDRTIILTPVQRFYGGIENSINFKNVRLDFLFAFVKQVAQKSSIYSTPPFQFQPGVTTDYGGDNQPVAMLDRWQKPGDVARGQRFSTGYNYSSSLFYQFNSDAAYEDASYLRLKNVSLSWLIPSVQVKKWHLSNLKIYAQGQNLLTITNYKSTDPETQDLTVLPPLRVLIIGIQVGL